MHISGTSPDGSLVEFVELERSSHPFFVATQAHPELKSRPTHAHPLFRGLAAAAVRRAKGEDREVPLPSKHTSKAEKSRSDRFTAEASASASRKDDSK